MGSGSSNQARLDRSGRICTLFLLAALFTTTLPGYVLAQVNLQEPPIKVLPAVAEPATTDSEFSKDYFLGPGDELSITDPSMGTADQPYSTVVPVLPDGTATIFPIGVVRVSGKTLQQLTDEVRARSAAYVHDPAQVIGLARMRPIQVYVLGDVMNPGLYSLDLNRAGQEQAQVLAALGGNEPTVPLPGRFTGGPLTSTAAAPQSVRSFPPPSLTALTALQMAGGARETADIRNIRLKRASLPPRTFDLWAMVAEGDTSQDLVLQTGDTLVVPRGGKEFDAELLGTAVNKKRAVRVLGSVKNPGIYELGPRDDVVSIISRAGGFTDAARKGHVILSRRFRDGHVEAKKVSVQKTIKDGHSYGRMAVMPGDVLQAQDSIILKTAPRALTIGATFLSAFFILYFSRIIVDQSQPQSASSNTSGGGSTSTSTSSSSTASSTNNSTQ